MRIFDGECEISEYHEAVAVLKRIDTADKIELVGGPWDGKRVPDIYPDNREITVWHGVEKHTYEKHNDSMRATHAPNAPCDPDWRL